MNVFDQSALSRPLITGSASLRPHQVVLTEQIDTGSRCLEHIPKAENQRLLSTQQRTISSGPFVPAPILRVNIPLFSLLSVCDILCRNSLHFYDKVEKCISRQA